MNEFIPTTPAAEPASATLSMAMTAGPGIERFRHVLKRRELTVVSVVDITPGMRRIEFSGEELADFTSLGFDDHVKLFVPDGSGGEARRDYTPRRFVAQNRRLSIDFALHDAGPATRWALGATPGDSIGIGGPRGSAVISEDVRSYILIADETGLPAMGRFLDEAEHDMRIITLGAVEGPAEEQKFHTAASHKALWVHRPLDRADRADALLELLSRVQIRPETFIWIAAEASVTRMLRAHLTEERGHPLSWMKASGYWVIGEPDAHEKFD